MKQQLSVIPTTLFDIMMILHKKIFNPAALARDTKISPAQFSIMFYLLKTSNPSVTEIAQKLHISKPNMTPLLDSLIELGYITRARDLKDRRILRVNLTEEGKKFYDQIREFNAQTLEKGLAALSEAEISEMALHAERLLELLKKTPGYKETLEIEDHCK